MNEFLKSNTPMNGKLIDKMRWEELNVYTANMSQKLWIFVTDVRK